MGEITVTFSEYVKEHTEFANKHIVGGACTYHSKPYGNGIQRIFRWKDGAQWNEIVEPITEETTVETHGIVVRADVKLWRTQYWSTESAEIKCFYEQD